MKKYSCFRFFLSAVLIPMVMACGKETSSRWEKTSEGTKLYIKDSLSTLFNKVSYTWRGDSMFGLAHGTGVLYGKDSDGETVYSREVNAWYGLIDKTDIRKMKTAVKAYCGPTKKDKPNGFGIRKEEGILYIGDFKKGKGTGDVIIMRNDGLYYAGEWEKDKIAGEGYMAAPDSSFVYEGGFRNGLFSGSGELFLINDGQVYSGEFRKGKYSGFGTLYRENVKYDDLKAQKRADGRYHAGASKHTYDNSSVIYRGKWKKGKYNGKGDLYLNDSTFVTHIWKKGQLPAGIGKLYDRLDQKKDRIRNYDAVYDSIFAYERHKAIYAIAIIIVIGILGYILYVVRKKSINGLYDRTEPMEKQKGYILWGVGGMWGLHRAGLCEKLYLTQYPLFALLLLLNITNIAVYIFHPSVWFILPHYSILTIIVFVILILWMAFDLFWIPYRIYLLTSWYFRRSSDELDILQGKKTEIEEFYSGLKSSLDALENEVEAKITQAEQIHVRVFKEEDGLFSGIRKSLARDGSLEFEQKKLEEMSEVANGILSIGDQYRWYYDMIYAYLQSSRRAAYRNMYLAKELIAAIKNITGKKQTLKTDVYNGAGNMDFNIDISALQSVEVNVNLAMNTFSDTYSMISGLGFKGGKAAVGAAAFSALVTVLDNIEQRNEQKLKIVKEQAKLISNIKEAAGEIVKSEAQILRCGEILSALYNANKAFIQAYCHLRDIVFGPISFHSYWYGIDKDNPELKTEEFISDIQHLVVVCSEYNKINQAK